MRSLPIVLLAALLLAACGGGPHGDPVRFHVPRGSGFSAVADTLEARGIVDGEMFFKLYAKLKGADRSVKPGVYAIRRGTAWDEILDRLVEGDVLTARVAVPEGWTAAQIAARIAAAAEADPDTVRALLADSASAARFGVPGPTLEGYLFPATYVVPVGTPADEIVATMVRRYGRAWTPEMRTRADSLGLSEREVVTLASIVEREARVWEERPTIAAVYLNRLERGMRLQADPTVQYALGEQRPRLLRAHIDSVADSPYNTYTHGGLPPGPIGSPGDGAIRAVLEPADVPYLFFVAGPDGRHRFTRTYDEHLAAVRRARAELREAQRANGR